MSSMTYKSYTARVEYDERDDVFVGRVLGLQSILSFEGNSVEALKTAFEEAVNDYLQECQEKGLPPEKPASGKLLLRLAPELHGQAMVAAKAAGKSLNQWVAEALHRAVQTD
jgi:predicted HicB family RNase H-like nuclease